MNTNFRLRDKTFYVCWVDWNDPIVEDAVVLILANASHLKQLMIDEGSHFWAYGIKNGDRIIIVPCGLLETHCEEQGFSLAASDFNAVFKSVHGSDAHWLQEGF